MDIFNGILGFHIGNTVVWNSFIWGEGSYSTCPSFLPSCAPCCSKTCGSPEHIGVARSRCRRGTRILPPVESGFLAGAIGRQVWATLELALGLSLDRAANELFYASLL